MNWLPGWVVNQTPGSSTNTVSYGSNLKSKMSVFHIGQRLSYSGSLCTVRYIGPVAGTEGEWLGVEWDNVSRGKHSGQHGGKRYFEGDPHYPPGHTN